jgi:hypothetical protein
MRRRGAFVFLGTVSLIAEFTRAQAHHARMNLPRRSNLWRNLLLVALSVFISRGAEAQTSYYNLDAGRPIRVEDAVATPRGELEVQLLPLRAEWVGDGTQRFRYEPKLSYGILPLTEIELRVPIVHVRAAGSPPTTGVASAGIGALHAFNVETRWPAFALGGELVLAVGSLSAPTGSYSLKGLFTKTFPLGRIEVNVGGGTWSIRAPPLTLAQQGFCGNAPGVPPCLIPDVPCSVVPASAGTRVRPSLFCAPAAAATASSRAATSTPLTGAHWTAALGFDHTLPLVSSLITADIVVDRYVDLYPLNDWTAEIGARRQLAPQLLIDFGISRRFAGTTQSTSITVGMGYSTPLM